MKKTNFSKDNALFYYIFKGLLGRYYSNEKENLVTYLKERKGGWGDPRPVTVALHPRKIAICTHEIKNVFMMLILG